MAAALAGLTLPAVVEELLSEMAAAVQENARSTGRRACVAALRAVDLAGRGGEARGGVPWACGAPGWGPAPAPALHALVSGFFIPSGSITKPQFVKDK